MISGHGHYSKTNNLPEFFKERDGNHACPTLQKYSLGIGHIKLFWERAHPLALMSEIS